MKKLAVEKTGSASGTLVKDGSETQTDKCLLNNKTSDGHPNVVFENVSVKKEVTEGASEELLSESQEKKERDNYQTNLWFDSEEFQNVAEYECEKFMCSKDDVDIKYSYEETVSEVVDTALIANISPNQGMSETNNALCKPQISTKTDLLKCLKTPTIQLERIQLCISRNSSKNAAAASTGEENIKREQTLDDSNCSEILSKELPFKCREISCEKSFKRKWDWDRHQTTHPGEKLFKCSFCPKSFRNSTHLKDHERIHNGERPYKCSFCSKSFAPSSNLKYHERSHTGETPYKCSFCSRSFAQSGQLKSHERSHTGETPYKCSFCWRSFAQSGQLKSHERYHTGEKPYKCSFCSKSFRDSEALKVHERIHSEEKPYKCSFCPRSFANSSHLKYHERTHSTERPYKCSICSKSFRDSGVLKVHETIHTGERPYNCSSCSKSFRCARNLRRHEMIHTGDRPLKCTNCEKAFTTTQHLTLHLECEHGDCQEEFILS